MKIRHDGDCTIYACLHEKSPPEHGICTCGYGWQLVREGDWSQMYSKELQGKLEKEAKEKGLTKPIEDILKEL